MSLILEALKKLEREKKTPERGFLVTTSVAWPSRGGLSSASVLGGLGLAAAGALGAWIFLGGGRPRTIAVAPAPATTPPRPAAGIPAPVATPLPLPTPPPLRPSPRPAAVKPPITARATAPQDTPSPEPTPDTELRLEAVSQRDGRPVAVVSGRLVHEGDAFDNVRVLRIGDAEVELEVDGQRRVLGF